MIAYTGKPECDIRDVLIAELTSQRDEAEARSKEHFDNLTGWQAACIKTEKQRDELLAALEDAATSLETIALRSYGEESYLDSKIQMRGYADSRAGEVRKSIARVKGNENVA